MRESLFLSAAEAADKPSMRSSPPAITAASWLAYILVFPILHATVMNDIAAVFLLLPLVTTAWHYA